MLLPEYKKGIKTRYYHSARKRNCHDSWSRIWYHIQNTWHCHRRSQRIWYYHEKKHGIVMIEVKMMVYFGYFSVRRKTVTNNNQHQNIFI